jgi:hypothetical protein
MNPQASESNNGTVFQSRRDFLAEVGRGMLIATVGSSAATELGLSKAVAAEPDTYSLEFGSLEPLVRFMQETPVDRLLPGLGEKLKAGCQLERMIAAAALANARTFGGEDYVGFHTMMALAPALHMATELPKAQQALPVFKVLYRNTKRIQEKGGRKEEVLQRVTPAVLSASEIPEERLLEAIHKKDLPEAERTFAAVAQGSPEEALNRLLFAVEEHTEVHRVVMPYRAWDLLEIVGKDQAHTLLRQSVHYCIKAESWPRNAQQAQPGTVLANLLDEHKLLGRQPGTRGAENTWIQEMSETIFKASPEQAAQAAAHALAEGFAPAEVGEAISLAANQLILRDRGRPPGEESSGKPPGSVHGDSIGVHACDSACAWRNLARVSNVRNTYACLILGAYQVALDRVARGGDFLDWQPLPTAYHLAQVTTTDPNGLLGEADDAIRQNLQAHAAAIVARYGGLGHPARPVFDLLLRYAVSEDGALHAEKYYRTVTEEFAATRPAYRWRQLVALARVTASEFGRPAPGIAEAREILKA